MALVDGHGPSCAQKAHSVQAANEITIHGRCVGKALNTISHRRQEPFLVARKTYIKPSTFVKYVIKLVGATNPIANSKFVEQYVTNNKANQIFQVQFTHLVKMLDKDMYESQ